MRRKIIMGLLAFGALAGFGSEYYRMKNCGGGCPDERRASFASTEVAPQAAPQAAATTENKSEHKKKGEHCDGWKSRWNQQEEKAPETPITTAEALPQR